MATLLLGAVGTALGGPIGGAVGAVAGALADNALINALTPHKAANQPNVPITSASEGVVIPKLWGRMRLGGNVIWCSRFQETTVKVLGTGKGSLFSPAQKQQQFTISFAVAFCEGDGGLSLQRLWADGNELDQSKYTIRFYDGDEAQAPDSLIESIEGVNATPAFRGICYAVFDTMVLTDFGNRMPQITAEIVRRPNVADSNDLNNCLRSVALLPGSGEFVYGTTAYTETDSQGNSKSENAHSSIGLPDLEASINALMFGGLSNPNAVMLVVTWFGTDLRAGSCQIVPKVETNAKSVTPQDWSVNGISRASAQAVSQVAPSLINPGSLFTGTVPAFGGTPSDNTVSQAIAFLKSRGFRVGFYPFIMMDIPPGNGLPDPYGGSQQAQFPWRGRITCSPAIGQPGTVDKTAAAATQINSFFSSYNTMVTHYATLCVAAGGVDAFVIGSELVGLTTVRSSPGDGNFPAVQALKSLAASIKTVVGSSCEVGYAADWSEYHSYRPSDGTNDVIFNMDPLWSDTNIDFVGIDNYLPLSDWRDTLPNADAASGAVVANYQVLAPHDKAYLQANVEGGEDYAWYYASLSDRVAQTRTPMVDTSPAHENWVFRQKDIRNWWSYTHYSRPGGTRNTSPTAWSAQSKPIWFTELGCPAVDKGSNQPNVFYDPKSSESAFPHFSRGSKDDAIQRAYLEATICYWRDNAPTSSVYSGPMVDPTNIFAWAWDARPYPDFPAKSTVWSDYGNWEYGHWLTGRLTYVPLKWIVTELAKLVAVDADIDTSGLIGATTLVPGYTSQSLISPRDILANLMDVFQFDAVESIGVLRFVMRALTRMTAVTSDQLVLDGATDVGFNVTRAQETDLPGSVKLTYADVYNNYQSGSIEARKNVGTSQNVTAVSTSAVLDQGQAKGLADAILQQAWMARETGEAKLPPSLLALDPGDGLLVSVDGVTFSARLKEVDTTTYRTAKFAGFDPSLATAPIYPPSPKRTPSPDAYGLSIVEFIELPLLTGQESVPWAPRIAAYQNPWPGGASVYRSNGTGYDLVVTVPTPSAMGELASPLYSGPLSHWDKGNTVYVQFYGAASLISRADDAVFAGANAIIVKNPVSGDWEVIQFANATLIGPNKYALSHLLRGQLGTEGAMANPVPAGARVIFLDATALGILDMNVDQRGIAQTLSYGPAAYDQADSTYQTATITVKGEGLRPYSVSDIRGVRALPASDVTFTWQRRTRFGGDNFDIAVVPLNEDSEAYDIEVLNGSTIVRTLTVTAPTWTYSGANQTADFGAPQASYKLNIYQDSVLYGRGQVRTVTIFL
ncbi:MAG: glycoside hydrolase/phage tail family protein [Methylobacteriaceae bacterium]|nr:glycoside hydrolase/phage tail family protein [Methylobacteriaceae bacterium]